MAKAVVKAEEEEQKNALTVVDFGDDAGAGMENVTADEFKLPFLRVLDPKSPQCRPANMGGIPGARGGSVFNTSTGAVWDGEAGFMFIPCYRDHNFIEWIPKNEDGSGGGFVGVHAPEEPIVGQLRAKHGRFGKLPMANGNQLAETFYLYGIARLDPLDMPSLCMISFASTQIPKYQAFVSRYQNLKYMSPSGKLTLPPLWAHQWRFKTQMDPPKGSQTWYGWNITLEAKDESGRELKPQYSLMKPTDELYVMGREFYNMIKEGKVKVNYSGAVGGEDTASARADDPATGGEDDIPM